MPYYRSFASLRFDIVAIAIPDHTALLLFSPCVSTSSGGAHSSQRLREREEGGGGGSHIAILDEESITVFAFNPPPILKVLSVS